MLLHSDNKPGAFLIRESESYGQKYWALSVLDLNEHYDRVTRHYRIMRDNLGGVFIDVRRRFRNLDALVEFHKSFGYFLIFKFFNFDNSLNKIGPSAGMCLEKPCQKPIQTPAFNDILEVNSSGVLMGERYSDFVALFNYKKKNEDDMNIKKGGSINRDGKVEH